MSEFEQILDELGSFGPYQVRVFILVSLFETPAACAMLLPILVGGVPKWTCPTFVTDNETLSSEPSFTHGANYSIPRNFTEKTCMPDGSLCPGLEYTGEFTSIVSEWNLICGMSHISDLITTVQMFGMLIGACIAGQLADLFGRKKILFLYYSLLLLVELLSAFTYMWQLYAVARFFIGGLVGGLMVVNFVLPIEFVTPKWRTLCGCVGFWAVGIMLMALLGYLVRDWRHLTIVSSTFGIPLLLTWWWIPESPRWLIQRERFSEAEQILTDMAKFNKKPIPKFDRLEIYAEREVERRHHSSRYSYWHLFKTWPVAKTSLIAMYGWFTSSAVYYGINFNVKNLAGNLYLNIFLSGIVEIPALILVLLINNRIGRRWTVFMLMFVAGTSCLLILILDITDNYTKLNALVITFALIGKSAIAGGWAATQVLSAEVFPTLARNVGIGACSMAARVGGMVAPQLVFLSQFSQPLPFIVFGSFSIICAVLVLFVKETKQLALPDSFIYQKQTVDANGTHSSSRTVEPSKDAVEEVELVNHNTDSPETQHSASKMAEMTADTCTDPGLTNCNSGTKLLENSDDVGAEEV